MNNLAVDAAQRLGARDITFKVDSSPYQTNSPTSKSNNQSSRSSPPSSVDGFLESQSIIPNISQDDIDRANEIHGIRKPANTEHTMKALCPICRTQVDQSAFDALAGTRRLTVREQVRFCRSHTLATAEVEWASQDLPDINWHGLNDRIANHHDTLAALINEHTPSFYRNVYEDTLKRETNERNRPDQRRRPFAATLRERIFRGEDEGLIDEDPSVPGYYGAKGARIIIDNLMTRFAPTLRRRGAERDGLLSTGGVDGFVRQVLVPELACLLIAEDLNVDVERAREVMSNSRRLGVVRWEEEEDEGINAGEEEEEGEGE